MKNKAQKFTYTNPVSFTSWGGHFDSLSELKFAISIWEEYHFMRSPVPIYYHPGTLQPVNSIRTFHRRYTPDFLIRHKVTGEALLIEIKPRAFRLQHELAVRTQVAENYIRVHQYDWKFRVVFDDEIILTEQQLQDFEECLDLKEKLSFHIWASQYNEKINRGRPDLLAAYPTHQQMEFLMLGRIITLHNWHK
ncbi:hypothetical protein GWC95_15760 [Sediminibacterium roseum]|uniref:TnsA endonuclease N terminal n=1 Tax=Sediminibacterium roseum TaxID=1978412 RepID=A0ABW9ZW81_9BACT|nr:hypothetical protein [Sediminibacterium roseum]NCI51385.1 hypothetical protein [Sediminibacterium roseum]